MEGERKYMSVKMVKAIECIKEVVKNHSDTDIYAALQDTNMDPNQAAHKLLNLDPFHEVKRKRDKKKDVRVSQNTGYRGSVEAKKPTERVEHGMKSNPTDHSVPRGGYSRNVAVAGRSREFRVVRDNRVNNNVSRDVKPHSPRTSTSTSEQRSLQVSEKKGSTMENLKSSGGNSSPRLDSAEQTMPHTVVPQAKGPKPNDSKLVSTVVPSNQSVVGVYSSSSDPVHVPSSDSRSAAHVGAIKRELGAVGVRRQNLGNSAASSSAQRNHVSTSHVVKDATSSRESLKSVSDTCTTDQPSKASQPSKTSEPESVLPSMLASKTSSSNQYNSKPRQHVFGHQKAYHPAKEWKRKSGPKSKTDSNGVIKVPAKSVSHPTDSSQELEADAAHVCDKLSQLDINENQNVFIAEHIRVSDSDRSRLTFGSFGTEVDSSGTIVSESRTVRAGENPSTCVSISLSASKPELPTVETSSSKHIDLVDDQVQISDSNSPASGGLLENPLPEKKSTSSPKNVDKFAGIALGHENNSSFTRTESQQQQDPAESESFSVYNPQTGHDIPYFRSSMHEPVRGQVQSPQETLGSHMTNNIPVSSMSMVQQQQQPMAQMYQQLHMSPFPNLMPYRQYLSPVYVPPMPMTGYSGNPTYPHPSNGNNFMLMPGSSSHLGANNLKYGIQQFKPVPGSPSGFGNFGSPAGYAMNPPGVVGGASAIEDSSRLKYKDGNLYVSNPQGETSEMWIQNAREMPNLQSASYYNMAGQTPHGAYMPPHSGHSSFNAAPAQSSHMQFPGLYQPPPQVTGMANPHFLGPTMGSGGVNVGMAAAAAVAPGAQAGAYQQPQMSHLNWNAKF